MKITSNDKIVIPLPLYHCFGMVLGNLIAITYGATMVYPSEVNKYSYNKYIDIQSY